MFDKRYLTFDEFRQTAKDILRDFKYFCEENNLRYYLAYGTLLGAVRHKDIIPWDYDIDVQMPRKDFNKFLELTSENPINSHLKTFSWENNKNYYLPFAKICDTRTRLVVTQTKGKIPLGVWIDVFPLDGFPNDNAEQMRIKKEFNSICSDVSFLTSPSITVKEKLYNFKKYIPIAIFKEAYLTKKATKLVSKYDYDECDYISSADELEIYFKKDIYESIEMLYFGDEKFACPKNYHEILTRVYGDYMKLPPEESRELPTFKTYFVE